MKKITSFKMEYLLYVFLLVSPFLDAFSFLFREWFPDVSLSPSTFLRPIIPLVLSVYLFFKDPKTRKHFLLLGGIVLLYGIFHLTLFDYYRTQSAYGTVFHEAQYILNYSYMLFLIYIVYYYVRQGRLKSIVKYVGFCLLGYLVLLYFSILTGTSSSTYIDGIGYKGYFASGNALGSIFLLGLLLILPECKREKKWWILTILAGFYLMFLLGTRTGMIGFPLVLGVYFSYDVICYLYKKIHHKKLAFFLFTLVVAFGLLAGFYIERSYVSAREEHLEEQEHAVIDSTTNTVSHITGDALDYVHKIQNHELDLSFMNKAQQNALLKMYDICNRLEIRNSNRRFQQLVYHTMLIKEQHNPLLILFGNGYLSNYNEMVLEMEYVGFLFNFGIIGFVLYMGWFLKVEVQAIQYFFKNFAKITRSYYCYLAASLLAVVFSLLAGYTFFQVSSMLIVIIAHSLLKQEMEKLS